MLKRWVEECGPKGFRINLFLVHVGAVTCPIRLLHAAPGTCDICCKISAACWESMPELSWATQRDARSKCNQRCHCAVGEVWHVYECAKGNPGMSMNVQRETLAPSQQSIGLLQTYVLGEIATDLPCLSLLKSAVFRPRSEIPGLQD